MGVPSSQDEYASEFHDSGSLLVVTQGKLILVPNYEELGWQVFSLR